MQGTHARPHLRALTSLRFFAALLVVIHHDIDFIRPHQPLGSLQVLQQGSIGVTFFFVLSGFVLAYNYADRLSKAGGVSVVEFLISRVARIMPLHLLMVVALFLDCVALVAHHGLPGMLAIGANATLTHAFVPMISMVLNTPTWSLSCEMFFYATFPFVLALLVRPGVRRHAPSIAAGCWLGSLLLAMSVPSGDEGFLWVYVFPPSRLLDFVSGACLGLVFLDRLGQRRAVDTAEHPHLIRVLDGLLLPGIVFTMWIATVVPENFTAASIYYPVAIGFVWAASTNRGWVCRLLDRPALVRAGEASFAMFVTHYVTMTYLGYLGLFRLNDLAASAVAIACSVVVGVVAHRYLERRWRDLARARLRGIVRQHVRVQPAQ